MFRISGTGETYGDYNNTWNVPEWYDLIPYVHSLVVDEGITKITNFMLSMIKSVQLPSTLYEIGDAVFLGLQLDEIVIPDGVEIIATRSFFYGAKVVRAPGSILVIGTDGFGPASSSDYVVYAP